MAEVIKLEPYIVEEYPWGNAVRHRKGDYESIVLLPSGQVVDVNGLLIELHENGIEIVGVKDVDNSCEVIPFKTKDGDVD